VNEKEVEVLELPVSKLLLDELRDVLLGVEGVPELGGDDYEGGKGDERVVGGERGGEGRRQDSQSSSRLTSPSLIARATPSPHSFSFPSV